jgi:hypothetical protein
MMSSKSSLTTATNSWSNIVVSAMLLFVLLEVFLMQHGVQCHYYDDDDEQVHFHDHSHAHSHEHSHDHSHDHHGDSTMEYVLRVASHDETMVRLNSTLAIRETLHRFALAVSNASLHFSPMKLGKHFFSKMMPRGYHTLPNISFVLSQILIWINKCHQF